MILNTLKVHQHQFRVVLKKAVSGNWYSLLIQFNVKEFIFLRIKFCNFHESSHKKFAKVIEIIK